MLWIRTGRPDQRAQPGMKFASLTCGGIEKFGERHPAQVQVLSGTAILDSQKPQGSNGILSRRSQAHGSPDQHMVEMAIVIEVKREDMGMLVTAGQWLTEPILSDQFGAIGPTPACHQPNKCFMN